MINAKLVLKKMLEVGQNVEFRLQEETTDKYGITHLRFHQYYNGIKVEGAEYLVHGENGFIEIINGNYEKVNLSSVSPQLTEQQGMNRALSYVGAEKYKWEEAGMEKWLKERTDNPKATYFPKGELVITPNKTKEKKELKLAWKFTISSLIPNKEQWVYIDAKTGNIIGTTSLILDANTPGTAQTMYSGTQSITCDSFSGGYRLRENKNGVNILTLNLQNYTGNSNYYSNAIDFVNTNTSWTNGSWSDFAQDQQALDAHWGAEVVYDYWYEVRGRNSIDDSGMNIISYVHYGNNIDNAYWDPISQVMLYGDGYSLNPLVALDVCAHEFGHGVNQFESNLGSTSGLEECDALNEGLSDIWAAVIEHWAAPNKDRWLIGEELFGSGSGFNCIRNLQNPKSTTASGGQHPDTYQGDFWQFAGEPHYNSTVLSHWFYLVSEGGSGTNDKNDSYSVTGIGIEIAAEIVYYAQVNYFGSSTNYINARSLTIQAAKYLYGNNSVEALVVCQAWYAVGVGNNDCSNATISGSNILCSAETYTIHNLPPGTNVNWLVSSNLEIQTSPPPTNASVTVAPDNTNTNGSGYVKAQTLSQTVIKNVWVGNPRLFTFNDDGTKNYMGTGYSYPVSGSTRTIEVHSERPNTTYTWDMYPTNIQWTGVNNKVFFYINTPGNYLLTAKGTNECGTSMLFFSIQIGGNNNLSIYPNPVTQGSMIVSINSPTSGTFIGGSVNQVKIYDLYGVERFSNSYNTNNFTITGLNFEPGNYILNVTSTDGSVIQEIIVIE